MNTIQTTCDASVGVQRLLVIPVHEASLSTFDDGTGRVTVSSANKEHIIDIPSLNEELCKFTESSSNTEGGVLYDKSISAIVREDAANNKLVNRMNMALWIVIAYCCDGRVLCVGSDNFPLLCNVRRDTSKSYATIEFTGSDVVPSFIVTNNII